jgi:hypothetical protein
MWPWGLVLLAAVAVSAAILSDLGPLFAGLGGFRPPASATRPSQPEPLGERFVTLVVPGGDGRFVHREFRIERRPLLADEVRVVLQALQREAHVPPQGTEIHRVFLDAFGILYLDLDRSFQDWLEASGADAEPAVAAAVETLTASFDAVRRVQLLVDGQELPAQVGRLDLRRPVRAADAEPPPPPVPEPSAPR